MREMGPRKGGGGHARREVFGCLFLACQPLQVVKIAGGGDDRMSWASA